jgi:4-diphosphocytidyl-2-C-methyl-D-erythritol kinase
VSPVSLFAPAKLNLFLAVTGRRDDGFHDLVSVVAQLDFGDTLVAEPAAEFSLRCTDPDLPVDENNLVFKAARAFAKAARWTGGASFTLTKRVPVGAGLGGGSSDAVAVLRALNSLVSSRDQLAPETLATVAAALGSDCPLFLHDGPVILRGRGERITTLPEAAAKRIQGRRVLVFKPGFGISTPWSYARLAARAPGSYVPAAEAEVRLQKWIDTPAAPIEELLFNGMSAPAFSKYLALPVLFAQIESRFGLRPRMSGSGSACYVLLADDFDLAPVAEAIHDAWGRSAFVLEARLT